MAWQRDEANLGISGATAYSYTEVDWEVHGDKCTYRHIGGVTSPYNFGATATSTLQWWEGGTWHDYAGPESGTFNGYGDLALVDVEDSFVRQAADRTVSLGCYTTMMGGSARAWIDYTVPHLAPSVTWAASNPVVRNSDNSITLTWNAPALEYSAMCLEVSTDGGSWSQFAVLWNTATSYTWTGCSAGHSYQFRIRTNYLSSYSAYDTCATVIVNTPLPPESISTAAAGGTSVTVNLVNPSAVATKVQYQVSNDDGATWGATQDSASLTSFTVTITGTGKVKAWNYNATGVSAAIETESITTICPPAKPTVNSPQSGDVWDVSKPLVVEWVHNKLDGSDQTAAKVTLVKDGTPPLSHVETLDPFTGNTYSIDFATAQGWISGLAVGDVLNVAVKTKGADASYSSNTVVNGIKAYTAPTLNITSPSASVTSMPVSISAIYSDMVGFTCQAAAVTLKAGDRTILTKPATISGTSLSCDISLSDALLDNGAEYTVVLDVRSSSGLSTSANASFTTAFTEPQAGELSIVNDPDTGYVSLLATFDNSASEITYTGATNTQYESSEGYVRSMTVEGKSEKWNQLVKYPTNANNWYVNNATNGATTNSVVNNALVLTSASAENSSGQLIVRAAMEPITSGHKYYFELNASNNQMYARFNLLDNWTALGSSTDVNGLKSAIITATGNGTAYPYFSITTKPNDSTFSHPVGSTVTFYGFACIDLTAIFGSGNEPANVDAFKATDVYKAKLAAGTLYTYDAGSLVSIEGAGVRGRNLLDVFTEFPKADTTYQSCTIVNNGDGSFTVSGTNAQTSGWNFNSAVGSLTLKAGTYTFQGNGTLSSNVGKCYIGFRIDGYNYALDASHPKPRTITFAQDAVLDRWYVWVPSASGSTHATISGTCYPMIVEGDQGAPWEPYSLTTIPALLRSAGTVHDQLQVAKTDVKVGRKVGVVDLGSLTWTLNASYWACWAGISGAQAPSANTVPANILSAIVPTVSYNSVASNIGIGIGTAGYVLCNNGSTSTKPSGLLFYELATPTQDPETSMSRIEIGSAFTVATDLDSTFEMTTWDGSADAVSISVSRVNADGSITPLLEDGQAGAGIVDKYAPLNTPYQYAVTTKSSANAVKTVYVDNEIITDLWFAYWGDNIASAKWNPDNGGIQLSRPQKTRVYYAGRKDPVSYDGSAVALSETPSWMLVDRSEVQPFVQLIEDGGRGVYKSCDGWVYHADFDLTLSPKYTAIGYYGGIMLSVTRIAGDQL